MTTEHIKINIKREQIKAKLRALSFKDGDFHVVYLPSMKISGYGETKQEAYDLAKISLDDFAKQLFKLPSEAQILTELKSLGWSKHKIFKKQLQNLSPTTYEDIKREFNIPDTVSIKEESVSV